MKNFVLVLMACLVVSGSCTADVVVMQTTTSPTAVNNNNAAMGFTAAQNAGFYKIWIGASTASATTSGNTQFEIQDNPLTATYSRITAGTLETNFMGLGKGYVFNLLGGSGTLNIQNLNAGNYSFQIFNSSGINFDSYSSSPAITSSQGFSSASFTGGNYQFALVAVPEPGTLLLGGIAACSGAAGAWWKRRKRKTTQPETTDQPATA